MCWLSLPPCRLGPPATPLYPPWHTATTTTASRSLVWIPTLGLSSLLSHRNMALQHAAHTTITSHIPWNTSSTLLSPVLPRSQTRPPSPQPLPHRPNLLTHPPHPPPSLLLISACRKAPEPREPQASRASHRALSPAPTVCTSTGSVNPPLTTQTGEHPALGHKHTTPTERGEPSAHPWETWEEKRRRFWW